MKNKVLFIFLTFILVLVIGGRVKAATYTSQESRDCESTVCTYSVVDGNSNSNLAFCLNKNYAYSTGIGYEIDNTPNLSYPLVYYICGLNTAYRNLPEMRNDSHYSSDGVLNFNSLIGQTQATQYKDTYYKLINIIQDYIWEISKKTNMSAAELESCSTYLVDQPTENEAGSVSIELGDISYDKTSKVYTIPYVVNVVNSEKIKDDSLIVKTIGGVGTLSNINGSGTLTLTEDEVLNPITINVAAKTYDGISHLLDTNFTVLSPTTAEKQTLGIPYLKRTIVEQYSDITESKSIQKFKISKKDITNESEVEGAKICISEYDTENEKKGETYLCFESGKDPYSFIINPGTYILEEEVAPEGYEKVETGFVFTITDDNKVELKDVKSKLIKNDNNIITIYDTPIKDVSVEDTGASAKSSYIIIGLILVIFGGVISYIKCFRNKKLHK